MKIYSASTNSINMQYSLSNALSNAMPFIRSYWQLIVAMALILLIIWATHYFNKLTKSANNDYDETENYW